MGPKNHVLYGMPMCTLIIDNHIVTAVVVVFYFVELHSRL